MKTTKTITIAVAILLFACRPVVHNAGPQVTEDREMPLFEKLTLQGDIDVVLTEDSGYTISIETGERKMKYIDTEVINKRLTITELNNRVPHNNGTVVYVSGPVLHDIEIEGSGDISGDDLVFDELEIEIEGSGDIELGLVAEELQINIQGSGDIELQGWAESLVMVIEGSGDLQGQQFETENTSLDIIGSGDSWIYVTDSLHVNIFGSGDVYYRGNPDTIVANIQGSGDLIDLN